MEGRCGERVREREVGQRKRKGRKWKVESARVTCNGAGVAGVMGVALH